MKPYDNWYYKGGKVVQLSAKDSFDNKDAVWVDSKYLVVV